MRIATLTLKDFRCHAETVLELDRFTFIRGPNDCGKSSIQMALEFLFTGRCASTDAAGRGAELLIRTGAKEFDISAKLDTGLIIRRRRGPKSHIVEVDGDRIPVELAVEYLQKHVAPSAVLSAALNADHFVDMSEAQQQQFLAGLVGTGAVDVPAQITEALHAIGAPLPDIGTVVAVNAFHARLYDMRSETNRNLKALGEMEPPEIPPDAPLPAEVKKKTEELRQQKELLIAQEAEMAASWRSVRTRLHELRSEIEEATKDILDANEENELIELISHRNEAAKLREELAGLNAEARSIEESLSAIAELKSVCPTCGQAFPDAAKCQAVDSRRERLGEIAELIQGAKEELSEYPSLEDAVRRLETHRSAANRRTKLLEEQAHLQVIEEPDSESLQSRLTILCERISKAERIFEKAQQAQAAKANWETFCRQKSLLKDRAARLDAVVEFFGPSGAVIRQVSNQMRVLSEDLNHHLAIFGYGCDIRVNPYELRVSPYSQSGVELRLDQLSESGRFRFSVAFQLAVASLTGVGLAVIDRADVLDNGKRKLLTSLLLKSSLDQAIVLATSESAAPELPGGGVKFLSLSCSQPTSAASAIASVQPEDRGVPNGRMIAGNSS